MANGIPTDPPNSRTIDFGALVRKTLGDEYHKHEKVYQFSDGRKFESSDYGTHGFYGGTTAIVRSGTAQDGGASFITLATSANGSPADYQSKVISAVDFATTTQTSRVVDFNVTSKVARVVPPWSSNFVLHTGTAQSGTNGSLTLSTGAPSALSGTLSLTSGLGSVQARNIVSYNGTTKAAMVSNWNATHLSLPGVVGNYASTPDSAAVSITGDIDIRAKISLSDWTPTTAFGAVTKYDEPSQISYLFRVEVAGTLRLFWSENGSSTKNLSSSVSNSIVDGTAKWIRVTLDADNGASGHTARFYTSDDGVAWTQLGTDRTGVGVTSIFDSTAEIWIGANEGSSFTAGNVYYAEIRNGIEGAVVAAFDPSDAVSGVTVTSFTSSQTGEVWTINQSGATPAQLMFTPDSTTLYQAEKVGPGVNTTYTISA